MGFREPIAPDAASETSHEAAPLHPIRCAACRHPITTREAGIVVDGRHDHRCVNPHGVIFDIGCYTNAPGLVVVGEPEAFFSWFPGTTWQIGLCVGCHAHLGWLFVGRERPFVALVLDRITHDQG
ncbi:MAG: hypothetical protein IT385_26695 [Deltaproteobacteria bacterium]|nr:hypothetical protein [Deltaproteobacteria bacterium]